MASWMVHIRIADLLLNKFKKLEETEFVMGNIAPDSGVPSDDWSYWTSLLQVQQIFYISS